MIKTKRINGMTIMYKDDQTTRDAVFEKVLAWFVEMESFNGECIIQCDNPSIDAPNLLADLADDFFEFDVEFDEEE